MTRRPRSPTWLRRPRESEEARSGRALRDALHLLEEGLCAVCRERDTSARRWLAYFITESHTDEGVRARLTTAAGFCPAHTRHLLADVSVPWLMPQVHQAALSGARRLLADDGTRPSRCPACVAGDDAAERALATLLRALDQQPVDRAVSEGAVCLPHIAELAAQAPPETALRLTDTASARLGDSDVDVDLMWLVGADPDAAARATLHDSLDAMLPLEEAHQRRAVLTRWDADIELDCCPLCLAEHRAARRLLAWAAATTGTGRPGREETGLCPRHLHDLASIGGPNVPAVLEDNRDAWAGRLARFRRLATGDRQARSSAAPQLRAASRCRACEEERTACRRQAALLAAAVRDPVRARAYEQTHGVCLHHALTQRQALPQLAYTVLDARLALLAWEVDEALRKQDWHTRHEVKGAEMAIGSRAPTVLDGRVYAGQPARTRGTPTREEPAARDERDERDEPADRAARPTPIRRT